MLNGFTAFIVDWNELMVWKFKSNHLSAIATGLRANAQCAMQTNTNDKLAFMARVCVCGVRWCGCYSLKYTTIIQPGILPNEIMNRRL